MNDGVSDRSSAARSRSRRLQALTTALGLYGAITLGGIVGSLLRWLVSLALPAIEGGLPWATFLINASGCLVIGCYAALTGPDGRLFVGPRMRQFVMTGICGGYTTFSGFSLETMRLVLSGNGWSAGLYLAMSLVSWLVAVWLGDALAGRLNTLEGE
jgi:CrcB protein